MTNGPVFWTSNVMAETRAACTLDDFLRYAVRAQSDALAALVELGYTGKPKALAPQHHLNMWHFATIGMIPADVTASMERHRAALHARRRFRNPREMAAY